MNYSNPTELQAAIEGNKREGRRTSYGTYPEVLQGMGPGGHHHMTNPLLAGLPGGPPVSAGGPPTSLHHSLNGNGHPGIRGKSCLGGGGKKSWDGGRKK